MAVVSLGDRWGFWGIRDILLDFIWRASQFCVVLYRVLVVTKKAESESYGASLPVVDSVHTGAGAGK